MGSSSRSSNIGNRQKSANEVGQPVVGIGDVVEQIELLILMKSSGRKVGLYLPEVVVKLMGPLNRKSGRNQDGNPT